MKNLKVESFGLFLGCCQTTCQNTVATVFDMLSDRSPSAYLYGLF